MKKPTTFKEAMALVPTHWPLTPGVDSLRYYDELWAYNGFTTGWLAIDPQTPDRCLLNKANHALFERGDIFARRPIPKDVMNAYANLVLRVANNCGVDDPDARKIAAWILGCKP